MGTIKYFTPDIEDFHVGYEFQRFIPRGNATEEECWQTIKLSVNYLTLDEIDDEIIEKEIRVPYLTKEQIEAEGWNYLAVYGSDGNDKYVLIFEKKTDNYVYELSFKSENEGILIEQLRSTVDKTVREKFYKGECKDINTFRKIIKLLNIK